MNYVLSVRKSLTSGSTDWFWSVDVWHGVGKDSWLGNGGKGGKEPTKAKALAAGKRARASMERKAGK